jgi:hypothetical protein
LNEFLDILDRAIGRSRIRRGSNIKQSQQDHGVRVHHQQRFWRTDSANYLVYVINWLPVYNYTVGILTVFVTTILIWATGFIPLPLPHSDPCIGHAHLANSPGCGY